MSERDNVTQYHVVRPSSTVPVHGHVLVYMYMRVDNDSTESSNYQNLPTGVLEQCSEYVI